MVDQPEPGIALDLQKPCAHHWLIGHPTGETSRGVCKYCGAIRDFRNAAARGPNQYANRRSQSNSKT